MQVGGDLLLTPKLQLSHDMRTMICAYVLFACLVHSYALPSHPMLIMQPCMLLESGIVKRMQGGQTCEKTTVNILFWA